MKTSARKPYDMFPAIEKLKAGTENLSEEELSHLKATVALNASDPEAVSLLVDLTGDNWAHIYPPLPKAEPVSTGKAIETFLEKYGKSTPEEEALLERLIFNPVPEYSGVLEKEERGSATAEPENDRTESGARPDDPATLAAVARSINKPSRAMKQEAEKGMPKQTPLTFELAKIFVKQGRFDRAYEIISKINLNNPEKSVYFADQLRFLEKLMKISAAKKEKADKTKGITDK